MSPLLLHESSQVPTVGAGRGSTRPVDQFHKVQVPENPPQPSQYNNADVQQSAESEEEAKRRDAKHEQAVKDADAYWSQKAKEKDWDCVMADLSVYRYCGRKVVEDPRRTKEYRERVLKELGFGPGSKRPGLIEEDMEGN